MATNRKPLLKERASQGQLREPDQVAQILDPNKEHAAPRIPDLARGGLAQDTGRDVMADLRAEIFLDLGMDLTGIDWLKGIRAHCMEGEKFTMAFIELRETAVVSEPVDLPLRHKLEAVGERIIPGRPDFAVLGPGRDAEVIETHPMLLDQADCSLSPVGFPIKEPEELLVIFPIPPAILQMLKARCLHFGG